MTVSLLWAVFNGIQEPGRAAVQSGFNGTLLGLTLLHAETKPRALMCVCVQHDLIGGPVIKKPKKNVRAIRCGVEKPEQYFQRFNKS